MDKLGMILDELLTTTEMIAETREAIEGTSKCPYATAVLINDLEDNIDRRAGLMEQLRPFGIKTQEDAKLAIFQLEKLEAQRFWGTGNFAAENENGGAKGAGSIDYQQG